jgi:hypothetical protein
MHRMIGGREQDEFAGVNDFGDEAGVAHRERDYAKIDALTEDSIDNGQAFGTADADRDLRAEPLKLGEDLRQEIEAGGLVGSDGKFAARSSFKFFHRAQRLPAGEQCAVSIFEKDLATLGERDAATGAVKEAGADLLLQGLYLRGDGWLSAEHFLRGAREAMIPRYLNERPQLFKIHIDSRSGLGEEEGRKKHSTRE